MAIVERITSVEALSQLLDDWGWFHDASCRSLSPPPGGADTPERVDVVLKDMGVGGYNAGDLRTYRMIRLTASGVREWSFDGPELHYSPDHLMQEAELIDTAAGFGFTLEVPTDVRLVAEAFEYELLPEVTEPLRAWTSDDRLYISSSAGDAPSPRQWVQELSEEGADVSWRVFGGSASPIEDVPADYTGWFLERISRLDHHDGGVFVFAIGEAEHPFHITIENKGADDELWRSACRFLADWFPDGEFHSGNCRFTAEQFLDLLAAEGDAQQGGRRDDFG